MTGRISGKREEGGRESNDRVVREKERGRERQRESQREGELGRWKVVGGVGGYSF